MGSECAIAAKENQDGAPESESSLQGINQNRSPRLNIKYALRISRMPHATGRKNHIQVKLTCSGCCKISEHDPRQHGCDPNSHHVIVEANLMAKCHPQAFRQLACAFFFWSGTIPRSMHTSIKHLGGKQRKLFVDLPARLRESVLTREYT